MGFYSYGLCGFFFRIFKVISPYELITIFFNMGFDLVLKGFHKLETKIVKNYINENLWN
jgi:hypothetical protein